MVTSGGVGTAFDLDRLAATAEVGVAGQTPPSLRRSVGTVEG